MQPNSSVKFDRKSFDIIKKTIRTISTAKKGREHDAGFATQLPMIVGLKLTNKCNLRCKHCYEWNEDGYHRDMALDGQNAELDFDIVKKVMKETKEVKSGLYLWGGEPLVYSHFDQLAQLLEHDNRITAICTNGVWIEQKMDLLLKIGPLLELLIALDGFETENDAMRGKGTYGKVIKAIEALAALRKKAHFKGKISLHMVINENMIGKIYDFIGFFEQKGVDTIFLCFPWYISAQSSRNMSRYFEQNFGFLEQNQAYNKYSWDAFKYGLDTTHAGAIIEELERIRQKTWKTRVRYQPALKAHEIQNFLKGEHIPAQGREKCLSISTRMDILPDGSVSSCKHFPEFSIGSLKDRSVYELWNCDKFRRIREMIDKALMPVCSKCNNLYLHGS